MRRVREHVTGEGSVGSLLLLLSVALLSAPVAEAGSDVRLLPLRWCLVEGSPTASEVDPAAILVERHEGVGDATYVQQGGVDFRSAVTLSMASLDFPTIPDPDTSAGQPGDIDLADPAELRAAIRACDAAWVDRLTEDSLPGIVVINARTLGSSPGYGTPNGVPGGDFAADATWTPGYVFVQDRSFAASALEDTKLLGQKLGNAVALWETATAGNLMTPTDDGVDLSTMVDDAVDWCAGAGPCTPDPFAGTAPRTLDQRAWVRQEREDWPGQELAPGVSGSTQASLRNDALGDVPEAEGFVDLSSVRVASDATGSTLRITHTVAARVEDRCGNGVIDPGEECDDGPANGTGQGCSAECKTIVSDEFDGPTIDTDVWTIVDPLNDATHGITMGGQLSIEVPGGTPHDAFVNGNEAPRLMQDCDDSNFQIETKIDSVVNQRFQAHGLMVEETENLFLRFDTFSNGTSWNLFATFVDVNTNSQEAVFNLNMGDEPSPLPLYLRLTRSGDLWTFEHSLDGTMWMLDGMVTRSLVVSRVGVWAGNAGPAPTITGLFDYFRGSTTVVTLDAPEGETPPRGPSDVGVADLLGQRKTVVRGVPGGAEPQADYWVLIDADNDSGTGGTPPGYPAGVPMTTFTGVELITRVSAGLRTQILAPTVWTWDGSVFVESMDAGIAAFFERGMFEPGVLPGQDSPEVSATFDNVSIELPGSLGAALTDPFRLQAFAVNPTTATVDRLEDTDAGLGYSLGAPVFPVCSVDGVEVNPGAPASVTVSGLVPASDVRIIFGDEQVGLDTTDATGGGQFAFTVPPMASEGRHPVTVGNLGTGLTADCTTLVVIATNQPPVAMCQNVSKAANEQCEAVVLPAEVDNGSFDPEDGPLELTLEPTSPYALGMTPVTLTVTDDGGLSDTCDATITVVDETAPTISCPADVTIRCGESTDPANTGVATADDNCMGVAVDFGDQDPGSCPGTIVRTWTATDGSGNTASCTQSIMQVDENQPPVAMCQDVTAGAGATCQADVGAEHVDAGSFDPDGDAIDLMLQPAGPYDLGRTLVTLVVTDAGGLMDTCNAAINVVDDAAPIITCPPDVTVDCGSDTDPGSTGFATAKDNCSMAHVDFVDHDPETCPGTIIRTWTATDDAGNKASCVQYINRVDDGDLRLKILVEVVPEERGKHGVDDAVFRFLGVDVAGTCPSPSVYTKLNGYPVHPGDVLRLKLEHDDEPDDDVECYGDDCEDDDVECHGDDCEDDDVECHGDDCEDDDVECSSDDCEDDDVECSSDDCERDDDEWGISALNYEGLPLDPFLAAGFTSDEHDDGLEFALRLEAPEFVFEARVDCGATAATAAAALLIEDFAGAELDVDEVVPGTERGRGVPKTADDQEEFEDHVEDLLEKGFVNPPGLPSALIHTTGWHTQSRLGPDSEQLSEGRLLKRAPPTEDGPQAIDPD